MNTLARIISVLFHPLLIPTYLFILLSVVFPAGLDPIPGSSHLVFIVLIFIVTFALPALNVWVLKTFGLIYTVHIEDRRQRVFPFILITVIYISVTYMFYYKSRIDLHDNFMKLMIIIDGLVLMATLVTVFYKLSVHSLAIWGTIGILIPLNKITAVNLLFYPIIVVVLLAGLIMSARLMSGVHSLKEVMWGSIVGLATSIIGMSVLY